ncbi:hypothetical protein [Streptomyces sp. NBC_00847]|uniref:hypothetical protein n=1 Tax=Streptomyces sp. NBC_00847 TaxID=2975850 RepID=UPI00225056AE|nr:hypothetical protein [Streptomyces sp. NBC_00847]MCX4882453.1 hypothetical protein [Streptomyces sp. NBC_00847]
METTTRPRSPQPTGTPRWVAQFYQPSSTSWQVCAESPHRAPVQYALGEMAQTVRARGGDLTVSLWGPKDGAWQRHEVPAATAATDTATDTAATDTAVPGTTATDTAVPATAATDTAVTGAAPHAPFVASEGPMPSPLAERLHSRRQQVLMAGLSKAGLHDLTPDDHAAVQTLAEQLDETTVRRIAQWLGRSAGQPAGQAAGQSAGKAPVSP